MVDVYGLDDIVENPGKLEIDQVCPFRTVFEAKDGVWHSREREAGAGLRDGGGI
jgi:hypothetical protein